MEETGWYKLDPLFNPAPDRDPALRRKELLERHGVGWILLYAPTFSPSLTSAPYLEETLGQIAGEEDLLLLVKFHDKMDPAIKEAYRKLASDRLIILEDDDITPWLQVADLLISDTSSAVYEFLLLDKPVITLNTRAQAVAWSDAKSPGELYRRTLEHLRGEDPHRQERKAIIRSYHPYRDGRSSYRMIRAVQSYLRRHGVPTRRRLPLLGKLKMLKRYGRFRPGA